MSALSPVLPTICLFFGGLTSQSNEQLKLDILDFACTVFFGRHMHLFPDDIIYTDQIYRHLYLLALHSEGLHSYRLHHEHYHHLCAWKRHNTVSSVNANTMYSSFHLMFLLYVL